MSRKPDPRPERTKALLLAGLRELIQEKRWDRIRVQDILDRTNVGRSTFYSHFDNKFDLLTAGIPRQTLPIAQADGEPDLLPLFEHVAEIRPVLLPLLTQPLLGEILETFQRELFAAWTEHLAGKGIPAAQSALPAQMLASGFLSVAREWMKDECVPPPAVMCAEFTTYTASILQTAVSGSTNGG